MIIITGGAGFIGSVLLWKLNSLGLRDILVVDQKAKSTPKWKNLEHLEFADYMESDAFLESFERGSFKGKATALFHMGACTSTTELDKKYLRENNSLFSERLAGRALADGIYFSYASSAAAYGAGELGYSDDDALTPRLKPLNPYGQSKLDFDTWVLKNKLESRCVGFRFFNVYGPNEYHKGDMRSMVHKGFEQVMKTGKLRLFKSYKPEYPDGGQKRDFVYVKDVADVLIWFYQRRNLSGIYNLGTGHADTWNDLAAAIFTACGKPKMIEYIDMPDALQNQYQYFTQAPLAKLRKAGCPVSFCGLSAGVLDYVKTHLSTAGPYLR